MAISRVQIVWRWKVAHLPAGEAMRWHFVAHGAAWTMAEAKVHAALTRSHGKIVRFLPIPE